MATAVAVVGLAVVVAVEARVEEVALEVAARVEVAATPMFRRSTQAVSAAAALLAAAADPAAWLVPAVGAAERLRSLPRVECSEVQRFSRKVAAGAMAGPQPQVELRPPARLAPMDNTADRVVTVMPPSCLSAAVGPEQRWPVHTINAGAARSSLDGQRLTGVLVIVTGALEVDNWAHEIPVSVRQLGIGPESGRLSGTCTQGP